ncbi:1-(5-phosphoribosyl)-5-[(5-phosphoribosylamino)methylideneamino]imidazole-4-carboxamide isomerase [Marilutibacter chinensis]|uniref:1-(5-phosphoribosyl)-5-[(5-phosphoribosylamino)methylideneamino] imidazole-4-carboxamide isomerase n=1 Tax=Marilutibacter chinensis TaxID=2912247 RepID=A0ABS9HQY9_9GAMM|nr:1-(5-phosphoribosyl)-5-[(5-phosphoribosylamino)methylideneamino]imidazole-4-carboxamide isomerase [Lysobacter chinensis]MCF7220800.1 1-(5-phosphoribosyl)-5-[(5-phosphoribosylamino)methylideneamino]imidazole-4-carboxamide isomerase [Lysobacter chinensis]
MTWAAPFRVLPAIDVRDGRVVRLLQGDYDRETRYPSTPLETAQRHAEAGARWLHLVDLDAARVGGYTLLPLLEAIKATTALKVQTGGGVRDRDGIAAMLAAGADRVVIGSLAVSEPERVIDWATQLGTDRVTVALDTRRDDAGRWRLPISGWTATAEAGLDTLLRRYADAGLRHLLCTDIDRDGTLRGPNLGLYRHVLEIAPELRLQASGGIRDVEDVRAAREAGCSGAVLGKALLDGRLDLPAALALEAPPC